MLILLAVLWYTPLVSLAISPFVTIAIKAVVFVLGGDL
jgi:hypothetical protein